MQQRSLGRSGLVVSRLARGTMTWGRVTDADDAAAQLKSFLDAGGNLLDTADVYGDGEADAAVGSLLGALVPRDDILIATKAGLRTAATGPGVAPLEVALAWVRDRPGVVAPILGARTVGQLLGALQIEQMTLPAEITQALDDVTALAVGYPERGG